MEISLFPLEEKANFTLFQGTVINHLSHGNVLRYHIEVKGVSLEVDVLFRSFYLFENGQQVYISVENRNCLPL